MKLAMALPAEPCRDWYAARQVGAEGAVFGLVQQYEKDPAVITFAGIKKLKGQLREADLDLLVIEGDPIPLEPCRLGLPERDGIIDTYVDFVKVLGDSGVTVMCPNWMVGINWIRTSVAVPIRGGALTTAFRQSDMKPQDIDPRAPLLSEDQLWDNLFYFLDRVLPVAEDAGVKLGFHPDDPPISPVYGVPRILTSYEAYDRLFETYPSASMAMTFCQANFSLMEGDLYEMAEKYGKMGKIPFVHFRDVKGNAYDFEETFHDDGPTDMPRLMRTYLDHVGHVPIRPDHVPTLEGDDNDRYGYTMRGRLYAMGYMKGLIDASGLSATNEP